MIFCCSCIMASIYTWSVEDSNTIQENITFLENEITRTKRLRDNGPTGEPWPKRPKISARVLDGPERKQQKILCGEDLHLYLIENCVERRFFLVNPPPHGGYRTLDDMKDRLNSEWNILKQHGRTVLCTYLDFGSLLREAFALHEIEKDSGRRTGTWKSWLQEHVKISETEDRRCRDLADLLTPYPRLRNLSLSYTEVYKRRDQLRSLLKSPGPYKAYWLSLIHI